MNIRMKRTLVSLLGLVAAVALNSQAKAAYPYNFPTYSKVKITRDPSGQSWLYLEFMWGKELNSATSAQELEEFKQWNKMECHKPNFEPGKAVEFEIGIVPKCFLQPIGGMDDEFRCEKVMGEHGIHFNIPNKVIPEIGANNCYVDLWNYWNPPAFSIVSELEEHCGDLTPDGEFCATAGAASGVFLDPIGNFAVGLHDASALEAGIRYSFRYPVEVNNSFACIEGVDGVYTDGKWCSSDTPIWEDQFRGYTIDPLYGDSVHYESWGRAQITMQTFNNECDLPDICDPSGNTYTCPHLIGIASQHGECRNVQKETDYWLTKLCVPTGDYEFTPGVRKAPGKEDKCMNEWTSTNLATSDECCIDLDEDSYYAYSSSEMYGTQVGDCDDDDPQVLQCTSCSPSSCIEGEWCQPASGVCMSCEGGCYGTFQSSCEDQCGSDPVCTPDCTLKCGGAWDGCDGNCYGCPSPYNCEGTSCVPCGGGNEPCCDQGQDCYASLICQSGICSSATTPSIDDVAAGQNHTCVVVNGEVLCFGWNQNGQLGNGSTTNALTPVSVKGIGGGGTLTSVQSITGGTGHTCALKTNGTVVCWGSNATGELGNGTTTQSSTPVQVLGPSGSGTLTGVTEVSAGSHFTCARTNSSSAYCWGQIPHGNIGGAHTWPKQVFLNQSTPFSGVEEVSSGGDHLCLRKTDDTVWCVGDNYYGQLGNGTSSVSSLPYPVQVVAQMNIAIHAGGLPKNQGNGHSCAWISPGSVYCWGQASLSQVSGTGEDTCEGGYACEKRAIPVNGLPFTSAGLAIGGDHACSLENGTPMCWGYSGYGQVGLSAMDTCSSHPCSVHAVEVEQCGNGLPLGALKVVAGGDHTCAVTNSGLTCWGRNLNGELGNGTTANSSCPIAVSGL